MTWLTNGLKPARAVCFVFKIKLRDLRWVPNSIATQLPSTHSYGQHLQRAVSQGSSPVLSVLGKEKDSTRISNTQHHERTKQQRKAGWSWSRLPGMPRLCRPLQPHLASPAAPSGRRPAGCRGPPMSPISAHVGTERGHLGRGEEWLSAVKPLPTQRSFWHSSPMQPAG